MPGAIGANFGGTGGGAIRNDGGGAAAGGKGAEAWAGGGGGSAIGIAPGMGSVLTPACRRRVTDASSVAGAAAAGAAAGGAGDPGGAGGAGGGTVGASAGSACAPGTLTTTRSVCDVPPSLLTSLSFRISAASSPSSDEMAAFCVGASASSGAGAASRTTASSFSIDST
jgi:hypothetical protein